jgi:LysR family transcriptional regulator, benzoate and cis,cis-muconate-responsive activator of ben and cat genes
MSTLELRHFRYAVAVADTLHFGQAAERLHISQPPLSHQIRQLEDILGVRLFNRTRRQVQLTKAGEIFVQEARVILAQAAFTSRIAERVGEGEAGQLIVAVAGPADLDIFVEIFGQFAKRHPSVRLAVRNMSTAEQIEALREGRVHAGFLVAPVDEPSLVVETVLHRPIVIALPAGHPLTRRSWVPLTALADEPHIMFARHLGPYFFDAIVSACRQAGFSLKVVHEVDNGHTAAALVAAGLGVCFVPAGIPEARSDAIQLRPVRPSLPNVDCHLLFAYKRESVYGLVELFTAVVRDVVGRKHNERSAVEGRRLRSPTRQ